MENITKRIVEFNKGRLDDMVKIKYELMSENLFRFYRGTCHIFYEDLHVVSSLPQSPRTWICGDLHLENFGTYKSDNRLVYFDINDFDEGILAPALWEIARMVTSIFVAFDSLGIKQDEALRMAQLFIKTYAKMMHEGKANYIERNVANGIVRTFLETVSQRRHADILRKKTIKKKDKLRILLDDPRHFKLDDTLKSQIVEHITNFLAHDETSPYNYKVVDAVFRLAGTGSVGVRRYAILLKSLNKNGEKYMLLDMKQSLPSSLSPFLKIQQPHWSSESERIVKIQKQMQNRSAALLSTSEFNNHSYVIQEMQPTKDSINFNLIKNQYRDIYQVIDDMAMLTASSQIRTTSRRGAAIADELIEFGQSTEWQKDVLEYAIDYSHQVRIDYNNFVNDTKNGGIHLDKSMSEPIFEKNEMQLKLE